MRLSVFYLTSCLVSLVAGCPVQDSTAKNTTASSISTNAKDHSASSPSPSADNTTASSLSTNSYVGKTMQATVTGYGQCLTEAMACGLSGSPGKDPTAAMSAYLIPHNDGVCGSCWKLSNIRGLDYHGTGTPPTIGDPFKSNAEGMVVLVNNACAPGADQLEPGAVGQCTQERNGVGGTDKLGSQTVLDLCEETDAVMTMWNSMEPGMAVADIVGVSCSEWSGTIRKVPWGSPK